MEVHLIRHGETDWNRERRVQGQSDSRLNDAGEQQARELAARIEHIRFDAIFCSSSLRTRQTAAALFSDRLDHIQYLDTLREIYLGPWEGSLYDEIESHSPDSFRHFWQEPHLFAVAGAENFYQLQTRAMDALRELQQQHHGKRVAVVSHGALIKTVLAHAQCLPMEKLWTPPHLHNCAHNIISFAADGSSRVLQIADRWIG
ncbi:MAG: histidine phosphatase family protein, partial [Gammaproteobacteria bacterium]